MFYVKCSRLVTDRGGNHCLVTGSAFAHRFTRYLEHDAMTLMNETVQDRVGQCWIAEIGVPGIDR